MTPQKSAHQRAGPGGNNLHSEGVWMCKGTVEWEELLEEFRALGGIADNLSHRRGPLGMGLFPREQGKPVHLLVPRRLLIPTDHIVFESGAMRIISSFPCTSREKAWFEHYQAAFSWGQARLQIDRFVKEMLDLPKDIQMELERVFQIRFAQDAGFVRSFFVDSRKLRSEGQSTIVPLVELANHGHLGAFTNSQEGIGIQGHFSGEVLVAYANLDAWAMFKTWGFASDERVGFALPMRMDIPCGRLAIGRQLERFDVGEVPGVGTVKVPHLQIQDKEIVLSYLGLGNETFPRLQRSIFCHLWRKARLPDPEETFDIIVRANRLLFLNLIESLQDLDGPASRVLREMATYQLSGLSH